MPTDTLAPSPFATPAEVLNRDNFLKNGRTQCITMRKGNDSVMVSYDAQTMEEYTAKGYNAIPVAEQNSINVAAARAISEAPKIAAAATAQQAQDEADTKELMAALLAQFRADKAKKAAPASAPAK